MPAVTGREWNDKSLTLVSSKSPAHPGPADGQGGVMNGLTALAPWWLLALVDLVVGGLCVVLAMRPRRCTAAARRPA